MGEKLVYFLGHYELEDRSFADRMVLHTEKRRNPSSFYVKLIQGWSLGCGGRQRQRYENNLKKREDKAREEKE